VCADLTPTPELPTAGFSTHIEWKVVGRNITYDVFEVFNGIESTGSQTIRFEGREVKVLRDHKEHQIITYTQGKHHDTLHKEHQIITYTQGKHHDTLHKEHQIITYTQGKHHGTLHKEHQIITYTQGKHHGTLHKEHQIITYTQGKHHGTLLGSCHPASVNIYNNSFSASDSL